MANGRSKVAQARAYARKRWERGDDTIMIFEVGDFWETFDGYADRVRTITGQPCFERNCEGEQVLTIGFYKLALHKTVETLLDKGEAVALVPVEAYYAKPS